MPLSRYYSDRPPLNLDIGSSKADLCAARHILSWGSLCVTYTAQRLEGEFSVKIEEGGKATFVSRCSFTPSTSKVTCDRYQVEKVTLDENVKPRSTMFFVDSAERAARADRVIK